MHTLLRCLYAVVVLGIPGTSAAQGISPSEAEARLTAHLASLELFQKVLQEAGQPALNDGYLPGASVLTELWVGMNASNSGAEYTFPLEVGLPPFKRLSIPAFIKTSELKFNYSPVTVTQESAAGLTSLERDVGQAASISYRLALFKGPSSSARALAATTLASTDLAARANAFGAGVTDADTALLLLARSSPAIREWQLGLWKNFKLSQDFTYKANWATAKQDEFVAILSADKGFGKTRPTKLGAQAGWSHFRPEGSLLGYSGTRVGGSFAIRLGELAGLTAKLTATRFYGDGFKGIKGVTDKAKSTDVVASQAVTFSIAGAQLLSFGLKESHLGTGNVAFGLVTEFGYVFKRK